MNVPPVRHDPSADPYLNNAFGDIVTASRLEQQCNTNGDM